MKRFIKYSLAFLAMGTLQSCDGDFEELNKNPVEATADQFNPRYLFSTAQLYTFRGEEASSLYYASTFSQQFASLSNVGIFDFHGDKYVYHQGNSELLWNATFDPNFGPAKLLENALQLADNKAEYNNLIQMIRIWKTLVYSRLTDMYGDIPYSEAGKGYHDNILKPKYDSQKEVYYHMLSELEDATKKLDASQNNYATSDIAYGGDIQKWKKLGYSMMLRLGMRLSKVEPTTAQAWVAKAFAGGTLASNSDNLIIRGTDATGNNQTLSNGQSLMFKVNYVPGKLSATLVNQLKSTSDPRLKHMAAVYSTWNNNASKNTDPAIQKGLPNGLDRITLVNDPTYDKTRPEQEHQYSGINRDIFAKLNGPRMFLTFGESQLLLAEAAVRGWISADSKALYESGVAASMKNLTEYDASAAISDADIAAYLVANPYAGATNQEGAFAQINTQYWLATFLDGYETFANVRRSGYPKLVPINYPDNETGGKFPGRLPYPQSEMVYNKANYEAAVARQGTDNFITRVWWDK